MMVPLKALLIIALATVQVHTQVSKECVWATNRDLPDIQPLYLDSKYNFLIPEYSTKLCAYDDLITIKHGAEIVLACPGSSFTGSGEVVLTLKCIGDEIFRSPNGKEHDIKNLACRNYPNPTTVDRTRATKIRCGPRRESTIIDIGFQVTSNHFSPAMEICFNKDSLITIYSKFIKSKERNSFQKKVPRPETPRWIKGNNFYPRYFNLDKHYLRDVQTNDLARYIGRQKAEQYIEKERKDASNKILPGQGLFLSRGHLTAMTDLLYGAQQRATFHYLNTAPQWQIFNAGNWESMESSVRVFGSKYPSELHIYTGTSGILELPGVNGRPVKIFLGPNPDSSPDAKLLRVPMYFWRVLYDPLKKTGVAFVGLNNPYFGGTHISASPCSEMTYTVCKKYSWLKWNANDVKLGFSYCCDVKQLAQKFEEIPPLTVQGLL